MRNLSARNAKKIHNQLAKNDEFYLSIKDNENNILSNSHFFIDTKIYFNAKCSSHFLPKVLYCNTSKIYICKKCCETGHYNCNHIKFDKSGKRHLDKNIRTKIDEIRQIDSLDIAVENKPGPLTRKNLHCAFYGVIVSVENKNNLFNFVVNRIMDNL